MARKRGALLLEAGPGEVRTTFRKDAVLRCPVLGSCVGVFVYPYGGRGAGVAHVMYPSRGRGATTRNAGTAIRELARRLRRSGARGLCATLVAGRMDSELTSKITASVRGELARNGVKLQRELYSRSKATTAEMDAASLTVTCSSRDMPPSVFRADGPGLASILRKVARRTGFGMAEYRRPTMERRLALRMARVGCGNYREYSRFLDSHPEESEELIRSLAINVTGFFRDPEVFREIEVSLLPELASRRKVIRAWSAGCSTGEEAYSLAMMLEALRGRGAIRGYSVLATDISAAALNGARAGEYPAGEERFIPRRFRRYLVPVSGGRIAVAGSVRGRVEFRRHNLAAGRLPRGFSLILCRNVLIFYEPGAQRRILGRLAGSLARGGFLVLGTAERRAEPELMPQNYGKGNVYRKAGRRSNEDGLHG